MYIIEDENGVKVEIEAEKQEFKGNSYIYILNQKAVNELQSKGFSTNDIRRRYKSWKFDGKKILGLELYCVNQAGYLPFAILV